MKKLLNKTERENWDFEEYLKSKIRFTVCKVDSNLFRITGTFEIRQDQYCNVKTLREHPEILEDIKNTIRHDVAKKIYQDKRKNVSKLASQYLPFAEIPPAVHEAAETLFIYFEKKGMREWQFSHVADRRLVLALERERDALKAELANVTDTKLSFDSKKI